MRNLIVLAAALPLLAACGSDQFSRVGTGAGAGAGTGAAIGLLGGPIGMGLGAAIGAGVGAIAGGTTTPDQIDLGKPAWRDNGAPQPGAPPAGAPDQPAPVADAPPQSQGQAQPIQSYTPPQGNKAITSEQLPPPTKLTP